MIHVALFGGAFDPPHVGHQQVAEYLLSHQKADQVWFVPVKNHPFGKTVEVNGHRAAMLELVLKPNMQIETYELLHPDTNYTADTLFALEAKHPTHHFSWVLGSDNLEKLDKWGGPIQQALTTFPFWVYPREGYPMEELLAGLLQKGWLPENHQIQLLPDAPTVVAASSQIKQRLKENYSLKTISDLVDPRVARYIMDHELYRS